MKTLKNFSLGFTMIELLVVITIIGILGAVMTATIGKAFSSAESADAREDLRRLGQSALLYKMRHDGHFPAAGGYFIQYTIRENNRPTERYGRGAGWVYFAHECGFEIGDGGETGYGYGDADDSEEASANTQVNEEGLCRCFDATQNEGGLSAQPAAWLDESSSPSMRTGAMNSIRTGALFELMNGDFGSYVNRNFAKRAFRLRHARREEHVMRAYAMNVIAGTDEDLYGSEREYCTGRQFNRGEVSSIQYGAKTLKARTGTGQDEVADASPARTVLFAELDLDNMTTEPLAGDQVWDWDSNDECLGFNYDNDGIMQAFVCFADGRVEAIDDPSSDSSKPDMNKRKKLSKWYGSGGVNVDGEKID